MAKIPFKPDEILGSFPGHSGDSSRLVFLSGPSGAGKTTWCMQMVEQARSRNVTIAGLISPAVFTGDQKNGIDLLNIQTGERRRVAVAGEKKDWIAMKRWSFDPEVLAWGNRVLREIHSSPVLIIDEIGPLEFEHQAGLLAAFDLIDSRKFTLTLICLRPWLVNDALERWPWAEVLSLPDNTSE
jgi:nucleoside-triphosphatase THEP1